MKKLPNNIEPYKVAAKNLGVKTETLQSGPRKTVLLLSYERKFFMVSGAAPGLFPEVRRWNAHLAGSKMLSQKILKRLGYNVITGKEVRIAEFSSKKMLCDSLQSKKYAFPVLIKRDKGQNANDISIVENINGLLKIARTHFATTSDFMIQPIIDQNEYRILVINNEIVLMHSKHNRFVTGDGNSTIAQLLGKIPRHKKDPVFIAWQHKKQKTKPSTLLGKGEKFEFHLTKIPTTVYYKTEKFPPVVKKWALKLAKDLSSPVIGLDVFIPGDFKDISSYTIIEINSNPGVHYLPIDCNDSETPVRVFENVLKAYFKIK